MSIWNCTEILREFIRDWCVTVSLYPDRIANLNAVMFDTAVHILIRNLILLLAYSPLKFKRKSFVLGHTAHILLSFKHNQIRIYRCCVKLHCELVSVKMDTAVSTWHTLHYCLSLSSSDILIYIVMYRRKKVTGIDLVRILWRCRQLLQRWSCAGKLPSQAFQVVLFLTKYGLTASTKSFRRIRTLLLEACNHRAAQSTCVETGINGCRYC
jgi:hypothetical protein